MENEFPYLPEHHDFPFPAVEEATGEGIVAVGGNLSPGMLLSAYRRGIFPWFSPGEPILWWSPDPRFILFPEDLHISRSMKKVLKRGEFSFSLDTNFPYVIQRCSEVYREGQYGTWITDDMLSSYIKLHQLGYAHSVEAWKDGEIVGGLYGVSLGDCFFGESMFSDISNASKAAFITFVQFFRDKGIALIDCQVRTEHLGTLGAKEIPRKDFLSILDKNLVNQDKIGKWHKQYFRFGK
ncbi:MAG: leucyl/phenylalanyl-tRNA--protein transferase [Spirochaetia bacterium]